MLVGSTAARSRNFKTAGGRTRGSWLTHSLQHHHHRTSFCTALPTPIPFEHCRFYTNRRFPIYIYIYIYIYINTRARAPVLFLYINVPSPSTTFHCLRDDVKLWEKNICTNIKKNSKAFYMPLQHGVFDDIARQKLHF
jgi:hypothetical protein